MRILVKGGGWGCEGGHLNLILSPKYFIVMESSE